MNVKGEVIKALSDEGHAVVVAITEVSGSTPRNANAAMIVTATQAIGSIGGGRVEHEAIVTAREMTGGEALPFLRNETLGPSQDQCCGGRMIIAFAPFSEADIARLTLDGKGGLMLWPDGPVLPMEPERRSIYIYGAGHVGRSLVTALRPLPFSLRWIDARSGMLDDAPEGIEVVETPLPEAQVWAAPDDAFHIVVTHSHALDLEIVTSVLDRGRFGFLGLIGSATKRARFAKRLQERGLHPAPLVCPIGLGGVTDKRPEVIAALTAAQVVEHDARLRERSPHVLWRQRAV